MVCAVLCVSYEADPYPSFLFLRGCKIIRQWRCTTISELMINEQIRDREVRVIGEDGAQLGIMSSREALQLAREAELDLVKIAPTAKPRPYRPRRSQKNTGGSPHADIG